MGLLHDNLMDVPLPKPDYQLSSLQVIVGFYSHIATVNTRYIADVLCNAIGVDGWSRQPSWIPNWYPQHPVLRFHPFDSIHGVTTKLRPLVEHLNLEAKGVANTLRKCYGPQFGGGVPLDGLGSILHTVGVLGDAHEPKCIFPFTQPEYRRI